MKLLISIFISTLLLWGDDLSQTAQKKHTTRYEQQVISDAKIIEAHYRTFIDTPPSEKKKDLAIALKEEIETFQARYENSKLIAPALELLIVVDDYLENH